MKWGLSLLIMVVACSPLTATETICPDGSKCFVIDCYNYSYAECVIAFGKTCSNGYDLKDVSMRSYTIQCHEPKKW